MRPTNWIPLALSLPFLLSACGDKDVSAEASGDAEPAAELLGEEELDEIDKAAQEAAAKIDESNADERLDALESELGGE